MNFDERFGFDSDVTITREEREATFSRHAMLALSIPAGIALATLASPREAKADIVNNHGDHTDHMDHSDAHSDVPHGDQNSVPGHIDLHHDANSHSDLYSHCDAHCDWHDDHTDASVTHHVDDAHLDVTFTPPNHNDVTTHTDHNDTHNDNHGDIPHFDLAHTDVSSSHIDLHIDGTQISHTDGGDHNDGHTDITIAHTDASFTDHYDVQHEDSAHYDHTDHSDSGG